MPKGSGVSLCNYCLFAWCMNLLWILNFLWIIQYFLPKCGPNKKCNKLRLIKNARDDIFFVLIFKYIKIHVQNFSNTFRYLGHMIWDIFNKYIDWCYIHCWKCFWIWYLVCLVHLTERNEIIILYTMNFELALKLWWSCVYVCIKIYIYVL